MPKTWLNVQMDPDHPLTRKLVEVKKTYERQSKQKMPLSRLVRYFVLVGTENHTAEYISRKIQERQF